ncbi:murein transglycosylase A [Allopontixanthobacter sp.]|uniref:murein transglycosylase A n=1 Tax=Allopontixanthobacter sp. TaxID=2906452 RepID=UPI002AB8491F|nr:murein transglycosylase A [Allopontixanthobacter sp.]MDZ4307688.1 murein transglycosylase A [Allopontixanthobacter sp.]
MMRRLAGLVAGLAAVTFIAGCAGIVPAARGPGVSPAPDAALTSAVATGIRRGPAVGALGLSPVDAGTALASFQESCPKLLGRTDASGLTRQDDWRSACEASAAWPAGRATHFFEQFFETARVGDGAAFATGYFEPEIRGSRTRLPGYDTPVYAMPADLVRGWPEDVTAENRTGRAPLGRYDESGKFVPYYDRAEIENGALAGRGLEIGWAQDPVEFFFLQIQGSGRLIAPDGTVTRIGYAGQNGREYIGIGGIMRERGLLGDGPGQYPGTMQGIMQYIRENPAEGRELMQLNKSWIFFRVLEGDGPLGALEVPVRRESSVAADPRFVPLGAPVWLELDREEANGMWIAQDTGGAIKGANRFDTFWGAGEDARAIAGGMTARGQALVLLPKGTVKRHTGQ